MIKLIAMESDRSLERDRSLDRSDRSLDRSMTEQNFEESEDEEIGKYHLLNHKF